MSLYNLIYVLEGEAAVCEAEAIKNILYLAGVVLLVIKIAVPIILIAVGMVELVQALSQQDENATKKATSKLIKKAVAAIAVFLIPTVVSLLMSLIGGTEYKECTSCLNSPLSQNCTAPLNKQGSNFE